MTSSFLHDLTENSSVTAGSLIRIDFLDGARARELLERPYSPRAYIVLYVSIGPFVESHTRAPHAHTHRNKEQNGL